MEDQVSISQILCLFSTLISNTKTFSFLLDIFIGFLKAYVLQFAYKSIVTEDWKKFLYSYFKDKVG